MYRILCVEDSVEVQLVLKRTFAKDHECVVANSIKQARIELKKSLFDLLILDIGLPDGDGLRFCSELKTSDQHNLIPVFILTGNRSLQEKIIGFQLGIEDFLVKPFEPLELKLRIESRLKKINQSKETKDVLILGNIRIHFSIQRVTIELATGSSTIELSSTEFKIFSFLARHQDSVKSRDQIISVVWGECIHLSDRTIDSHMSRIRKKISLSDCSIEAVQNSGYRITLKKILKIAS